MAETEEHSGGAFLGRDSLQQLLAAHAVIEPPPSSARASHFELGLGSEAYVTRERLPIKLSDAEPFLTIPSGEFALLTTHETVRIPDEYVGFISIRFRFKILGMLNVSGFHVDTGYCGKIVFAVYNLGPGDIVLRYRDHVFMLFIARL